MSKVAPLLLKGNITNEEIIGIVNEILTEQKVSECATYIQTLADGLKEQKFFVGAGQIDPDSKDVYVYATTQTEYKFKKKITEITKSDIMYLLTFFDNATSTTTTN